MSRVRTWTDYYRAHREDLSSIAYPLLDDPVPGTNWTALQPWDPEAGRGFLLVYRQDSPETTRSVALRNVPAGRSFALFEAPADTPLGAATSAELAAGIDVTLAERHSAKVIRIEPAD